jgi:transposase InsO family protein
VQKTCKVSQRRACRSLGQPLSTQRYQPTVQGDEAKLVKRILELAREFPRRGYRHATDLLRLEGWSVNAKRVYRLWRREGLKVPKKAIKRRRLGTAAGGIVRRQAERRNHVWSVDFIFDRTRSGRPVKMLVVIDEFTRECLALEVGRKFTGVDFVNVLADLFEIRGAPQFIRSDNGPEFVSRHVRSFLEAVSIETSYIEPGSPWQNGFVESFNSRFRDECLNCEEFSTLEEARTVIEQWRHSYNHRRPHGSLGGQTPAEFAARCADSTPVAELLPSNRHTESLPVTQFVPS